MTHDQTALQPVDPATIALCFIDANSALWTHTRPTQLGLFALSAPLAPLPPLASQCVIRLSGIEAFPQASGPCGGQLLPVWGFDHVRPGAQRWGGAPTARRSVNGIPP